MTGPMEKSATISPCGRYRYDLQRVWDRKGAACVFIGLNPSTADATLDDPTIRRCVGYAKAWGFGRLVMVNAYAFRATKPERLRSAGYPIGPENDAHLLKWVKSSGVTVAAWGANIEPIRQKVLCCIFRGRLNYLRITSGGCPGHPLYLPKDLRPEPWMT